MRTLALLLTLAVSYSPVEAASRRHIVGRGTGVDSPFGVVMNPNVNAAQVARSLDFAKTAGIGWTSIQFTWSAIQPTSGSASFSSFDQLVTAATDRSFRIVGRLGFSTPWNTTAPAGVTNPAQREHYPPADYDAWSRFVFTTVARYKTNVHHWEIWYEPDLGGVPAEGQQCTGFWCGTPAQYAHLLAKAYPAIKSADPTATVLFGGLALTTASNQNFLPDVLSDSTYPGWQYFDAMNVHIYGSKADALRLMNLVKAQLAFGGAGVRPVWVTEFGYGSDAAVQNIAPYFGGESGQAAYVKDLAPYLLSLGARKVFWFKLIDSDPATAAGDPFASYGLVTWLGVQKQAMAAYADAIKSYKP